MKVKDIMSENPVCISSSTTLEKAAEKMEQLDCGFMTLYDEKTDELCGVVTDRDITIRAVARGLDPKSTKVKDIQTEEVLYCFKSDSVEESTKKMKDGQVYRLAVLNNSEDKRICGVITLGDVVRHDDIHAAEKAARRISAAQQKV